MWKRVVGPTLLMLVLWLSLSGATTVYILWLSDSNTRILKENVSSIRAAAAMQESLWQCQAKFLATVSEPDLAEREHLVSELRGVEDRFLAALDAADDAAFSDAEIELIRTIRIRFAEYRRELHRLIERPHSAPASDQENTGVAEQFARQIAGACTKIVETNERLMETAVSSRAETEKSFHHFRTIMLIAGPAVGIWVGLRIARNLHRSMSQICVTLKDAASDLEQEIGKFEIASELNPGDLSSVNEQARLISLRIRHVLGELIHARQEAVASERLAVVGELAAGIAHEIRNPLTSIKLLLQLAHGNGQAAIELQEKQKTVILQEILRMEETVQALLDFARPPELHCVRHDLRDTIQRAINLVEGRAHLEKVAVVLHLTAAPLTVDGDSEQLHQVFVNLLINGIDSMPGGGLLDLTAESDPSAGLCRVTVADRGPGIPGDRMNRIFDPFVTTKPRGTGLGLAVSRRVIHEHGGTIIATNRPEGGATFMVELPVSASVAGVANPKSGAVSRRRELMAANDEK